MIKNLLIQYLSDTDLDFPIPEYQSEGSSGLDIRAYFSEATRSHGFTLFPGKRALISSGFKVEIPAGFEGQLRARSGLALKHGITLANGVGTIDGDFRGHLGVIIINLGTEPFTVNHAQRIAQLVIVPVSRVKVKIVQEVSKTKRNDAGFGSTGNY